MENKEVRRGNTKVHKPVRYNVNTKKRAMTKKRHLEMKLLKERKTVNSAYEEMAKVLGIHKSPYLKRNQELILDSSIEFIKRMKQENAVRAKLEQNKICMDSLLEKMDFKLQELEIKWKLITLLEEMKSRRPSG